MKDYFTKLFWVFIFLFTYTNFTWSIGSKVDTIGSTKKNALENKRSKIIQDIKNTQLNLEKKKKEKKLTISEKKKLETELKSQQQQLQTIVSQLNTTQTRLERSEDVVENLKSDLVEVKKNYHELMRKSLNNRLRKQEWLFLFSSRDLRQAFLRWQYLKQYRRFRIQEAKFIRETIVSLERKIQNLSTSKASIAQEQETKIKQETQLNVELEKRNQLLKTLNESEKKLLAQLERKQKQHEELNVAIEEAIRSEFARKRKLALAKTNSNKIKPKSIPNTPAGKPTVAAPKEEDLEYTPEESKLANKFELNKGKLPWPVVKGSIYSQYGLVSHPVFRQIKYTNHGIDIKTEAAASVRSVFEGEVVGIKFVPGSNYNIIVRHGQYLTVYANVSNVTVKEGERIGAKHPLGKASFDPNSNITNVHFEVWRNNERLNPSLWISRK